MEEEFDEIAEGKMVWNADDPATFTSLSMSRSTNTMENTKKVSGEKLLGQDPQRGENVFVKIGRYGPMVQMGDTDGRDKTQFAGLKKGQSIDTITLEEAWNFSNFPGPSGNLKTRK